MDGNAANLAIWVVWGGLALAFVFGFVAGRTNFCTMGAISDVINMSHWGRMRMWLLTIAVAVLGTSVLVYAGQIPPSPSTSGLRCRGCRCWWAACSSAWA